MGRRFYPAFLDLHGKNVLIVGGGKIALRKARAMISCGAQLEIVTPELCGELVRLTRKHKVKVIRRKFRGSDINGRELVFCATNNEPLNRSVGTLCRKKNVWANIVDRPALCGFIVPSVMRRGNVTFAVSTGGASPALAQLLRRRIEKEYGAELSRLSLKLKKQRTWMLSLPPSRRKQLVKQWIKEV